MATEDPRHALDNLERLIGKLAQVTFEEGGEGGGHDLGLWLDSGDINEEEYGLIKECLRGRE